MSGEVGESPTLEEVPRAYIPGLLETSLSTFTGYGGLDLAVEIALGRQLRPVLYCEIEAYLVALLVAKMEAQVVGAAPVLTDIKSLPRYGAHLVNKVGVLTGGFPCQPFSAAGRRKSTDDPRHLYPYLAESISAIRPQLIFLENVAGIISAECTNQPGAEDGTPVLLYVLRDLEARGYTCTWGVFSAAEVGAPHERKRVFILGVLGNAEHARRDSGATLRGGSQAGHNHAQGEGEAEQPSGAGRPGSVAGVQRCGVADASSERLERLGSRDLGTREEQPVLARLGNDRWPSRPGLPQQAWEPPRVELQAQRRLGGVRDGVAYRVDRLRALGNGVVPQQAARAFRTLAEELDLWRGV